MEKLNPKLNIEEKPVIVFVVNDAWFFVSHRLPLALQAISNGFTVHVVAREDDTVPRIREAGCNFWPWALESRGTNILSEINALWNLYATLKKIKPDLVHLVTVKAVLYGGLLSRWLNISSCVFAISGIGSVFVSKAVKGRILRLAVLPVYKLAISHRNAMVIFQNASDQKLFSKYVVSDLRSTIIRGSGVNLDEYTHSPEPLGPPIVVVMAARLLWDKGIQEFIDAAEIVQRVHPEVIFKIAGGFAGAGNPAAVSEIELDGLKNVSAVEFLDELDNVVDLYRSAHIVCLPSWREGLPRSLIEAAAIGRAVVTTDVPGCRDAIIDGETGIAVPVKNSDALAQAIIELIEEPVRRLKYANAGRKLASEEFSIELVAKKHMEIYHSLLDRNL